MKRFFLDVKVLGFSQVSVEADTLEEAEEKAVTAVFEYSVKDLRWKETTCIQLAVEDSGETK